MYIEFFGTSSVFIWSSFQSPTHGGEELGHLVWVAQLAGGENPEQTLQTKLGQAAALVFPPCLLHRTGNVCVPPHQHAGTTFRQQSPPAAHSVTEKKTHEGDRRRLQPCHVTKKTECLFCTLSIRTICLSTFLQLLDLLHNYA